MLAIPVTHGDITSAWLTEALRAGGILSEANSVTSVTTEQIGDGHGFIGELARLRLTYENDSTAPKTLISKLPTLDESRANMSRVARFNEREHRFYLEVADSSRLHVPRRYFSAMDLDAQRFVLLLEDLAPAQVGNQVTACSLAQARSAVRALAPFHAAWWEHERLASLDWMPNLVDVHPSAAAWWQQMWDKAATHRRDSLASALVRIGEGFGANAMRALQLLSGAPRAVVHGDYRLDNLFFSDVGVTVIDWQLASRGSAAFDVAFFLSGNVDPALRRSHEKDLLLEWHESLAEQGVRGYSFDQAWDDYRLATLFSLTFTMIVFNMLGSLPERSASLYEVWFDRCATAVADLDVEELLTA